MCKKKRRKKKRVICVSPCISPICLAFSSISCSAGGDLLLPLNVFIDVGKKKNEFIMDIFGSVNNGQQNHWVTTHQWVCWERPYHTDWSLWHGTDAQPMAWGPSATMWACLETLCSEYSERQLLQSIKKKNLKTNHISHLSALAMFPTTVH